MKLIVPLVLFAVTAAAQNPFHGNGVPGAYIANTPAVVGQSLTFRFGSPTAPNGIALLSLSGGAGPVTIPTFGTVGLDPFNPFYAVLFFFLDGNGDASLTLPLLPSVGTANSPAFFADALTVEAGFTFSISKTVRVEWADANSWESVAPLGTARQLHTATALGSGPRDNRTEVLICGGATGSLIVPAPMDGAELYEPLFRTVRPLPPMSLPRAGHRAERLQDGRVLITGGVTTGGACTATCEFFDPATETFSPAPSMGAPRSGHAMTVLDDGRVLVSGGVADWTNAATNFVARLNTAQDTAEIFDPVANNWSPLPNMASRRLGHAQTKLLDGRVLVTMGINGGTTNTFGTPPGQNPTYTSTCEIFDPATQSWVATTSYNPPVSATPFPFGLQGPKGFHGATLLPDGSVLVAGGFEVLPGGLGSTEAVASANCGRWNNGTWSAAGALPASAAYQTQVPVDNGVLIVGGFTGGLISLATTPQVLFHDGTAAAPVALANLGVGAAAPRATHTCTPLYDGTFLVFGGGVWPNTLGDGLVYTPQ